MYCSQCATEVPEGAKYCPKCAAPQVSVPTNGESAKSGPSRSIFVSVILLVILFFLGVVFYSQNCDSSRPDPNEAFVKKMATVPIIQPVTIPLLEKPSVIAPGQYLYVKFTVVQRAKNVRIDGRFLASGGSGNDIEVFIVDEDGFLNFQNGHSAPTFYNSGKVTADTLNVQLPSTDAATAPVTYYLVLSNSFSMLSNKAVEGNITLHYDREL
jgi:zinc-ribbon domain